MARKFTDEQVAAALGSVRGNISAAAKILETTRTTVYKYVERSPDLKEVLEDLRETLIDDIEGLLWSKALEGDNTCMIFFLKTQASHRGYGRHSTVTVEDKRGWSEAQWSEFNRAMEAWTESQ